MAKGKKREKRPNYVGSKSERAKQQEQWDRIHPNSKKKTVYLDDAPLLMFAVLFIWAIFLVFNYYTYNNMALMFPVTVIALCLIALLHMASPKRWIKSGRLRRTVMYVLFLVITFSIAILVYIFRYDIVIPMSEFF